MARHAFVETHINLDSIAEWALDSVTGGSRLLPANNIMAGTRFYRGLAARLAAGEARCGGIMEKWRGGAACMSPVLQTKCPNSTSSDSDVDAAPTAFLLSSFTVCCTCRFTH